MTWNNDTRMNSVELNELCIYFLCILNICFSLFCLAIALFCLCGFPLCAFLLFRVIWRLKILFTFCSLSGFWASKGKEEPLNEQIFQWPIGHFYNMCCKVCGVVVE